MAGDANFDVDKIKQIQPLGEFQSTESGSHIKGLLDDLVNSLLPLLNLQKAFSRIRPQITKPALLALKLILHLCDGRLNLQFRLGIVALIRGQDFGQGDKLLLPQALASLQFLVESGKTLLVQLRFSGHVPKPLFSEGPELFRIPQRAHHLAPNDILLSAVALPVPVPPRITDPVKSVVNEVPASMPGGPTVAVPFTLDNP